MDEEKNGRIEMITDRRFLGLAIVGCLLLWMAQPPLGFWWSAYLAIIPWLMLAETSQPFTRRHYVMLWLASTVHWSITLQGLRHANPLIYPCWLVLSGYLAVYAPVFLLICRTLIKRIPIWIAAPVAWTGLECLRNYVVTGLSAAMLAHSQVDVPQMIQIADIFGSYGTGFVIVAVNAGVWELTKLIHQRTFTYRSAFGIAFAAVLAVATWAYGQSRLQSQGTETLATFALIQRNEPVEYVQDQEREIEIFDAYQRQSVMAIAGADRDVDAVVWPESMFTGGLPLMLTGDSTVAPAQTKMSRAEFLDSVGDYQQMFELRASDLQIAMASQRESHAKPHLIVGCGVIDYRERPHQYSGVVHVNPASRVDDWYGKQHLVMFGEYAPILNWVPALDGIVPKLDRGQLAKSFTINGTRVTPNVCIETAVERVTVNQVSELWARKQMPDVIVTVTNDGWFDESSILEHHLRCAQLVAVGCRRPILSAANNGPTAWIRSDGGIEARLRVGVDGDLIATPRSQTVVSLYVRMGDWPAKLLALICVLTIVFAWLTRKSSRINNPPPVN